MKKLGQELKAVRTARGVSLAAVSEPAKISTAYLQKLENGMVQSPSPRVLKRLADVLDTPYERLMELADYIVPGVSGEGGKPTFLEAALRHEDLSEEEQRAVLAFVSYLKGVRPKEARKTVDKAVK